MSQKRFLCHSHMMKKPLRFVRKPASWRSQRSRGFILPLLAVLLIIVVLAGVYGMIVWKWSYSEGERAGVLQKFAKRGWICKTREGELAMYVVGGVAPQIWNFSVRDPKVVEELFAAVGKQVRLRYSEHRGLPTNCFGETDYFVEHVEVVGAPPALVPQPPLQPAPGLQGPVAPQAVPQSMPEAMPQAMPQAVPQSVPHATPQVSGPLVPAAPAPTPSQ